MTDNKPSKLRVSRAEASEKIRIRIDIGKELLETQISSEEELTVLERETSKWTDYNKTLFDNLFDKSPLLGWHGSVMIAVAGQSLYEDIDDHKKNISRWINDLSGMVVHLCGENLKIL